MNTTSDNSTTPPMPVRALLILVLSLLATWLAAGSLGWLAPPLQKVLTWLAFAAIVIVALPGRCRLNRPESLALGGAALMAVLLTASSLPVVNISAVAILLVGIAWVRPGMITRVSAPAALAATALAVFRLGCDGSAAIWTFANTVGRLEGLAAGWLTGRPLLIGASFGGLDFLVLMAALTAAWLLATPRPRLGRAVWALLFVAIAQTAYLVALAFSIELTAMLPPQAMPKYDGISHLGLWTWGNAIRTLLPWNLPVFAAVLHCAVAAGMFRLSAWPMTPHDLRSESDDPAATTEGKRRNRGPLAEPLMSSGALSSEKIWQRFGVAGLLIVAAVAMTFSPVPPDLKDRRIVAYDDGATDWSVTDPGPVPPGKSPRYGLLPALVESLGGKFVRSRELAAADLQAADVLIVLPPKAAIPEEIQSKIWRYVAAGGRLIVAGDPETTLGVQENELNALMQPTAISFRDDTANSLTERWEYNLQSAPHAATAGSSPGRNHFSFDRAASLRVAWPAGPLVVGRWAWDEVGTDKDRPEALAYSPGNHLGDLVLAAQQSVGQGTVVVLGAAACLSNDGIPFSYTFSGPLLSALAANHSTPLAWWRQLLGVAAAVAAIVLLFRQFESWQAGRLPYGSRRAVLAMVALPLAVLACNWLSDATPGLSPLGGKTAAAPVVYVDGSHLEGVGKDPWSENGIGRFMRVLAENNYLPLVAPDVSLQRLNKAAMLISIAPGKAFSNGEIADVNEFVKQGGFFLSMVGSPEAGPSRPLLETFNLHVRPMPVPPWVPDYETTPLGHFGHPSNEQPDVFFFAAWPVSGAPGGELWPTDNPERMPVIAGNRIGTGQAFIIGDSAFGLNKNFTLDDYAIGSNRNIESLSPNPSFWRSQLQTWLGHSAEKPRNVESRTGGIINLPTPKAEKGATP